MTIEIAAHMNGLERAWDAHLHAVLTRDRPGTASGLAADPSVRHVPAMTGGQGRAAVDQFYAGDLLPNLPAGLSLTRISRTVDRWRLVDESTVSFVHDRELPWLLPGAAATGRQAEVTAIAVVTFRRGQITALRVLWDHATLAAQLGLPALVAAG
jgi:carboxymethylenebutenolidase